MLAHLRPDPGNVRHRLSGVAALLVPLGILSGLCWAGCSARGSEESSDHGYLLGCPAASPMAPCAYRRQQTTTDLRSLCRNTHILPAGYSTGLHSGVHWMYTDCHETLTSRISRSHPHSAQLLDFPVRNPKSSSPVLLGTFVPLALN